uniref:Uncharacterized protein n=2 Tax=Hemiselmis tepida TaxID=464990 RepID=A0A7S0VWQ5_9CRYP|mmetsp:Transcript_29799/g.75406  ORF Transcript_29799/g.75406 Transcript_29799/m.75406 type:complete len:546 (+) Transcript_29799:52-1689(+)
MRWDDSQSTLLPMRSARDRPSAVSKPTNPSKRIPEKRASFDDEAPSGHLTAVSWAIDTSPPGPSSPPARSVWRTPSDEVRDVGGSFDTNLSVNEIESDSRESSLSSRPVTRSRKGVDSVPRDKEPSSPLSATLLFTLGAGGGVVCLGLSVFTKFTDWFIPSGDSLPGASQVRVQGGAEVVQVEVGQNDPLGLAWWFLLVAMVVCTGLECLRTPPHSSIVEGQPERKTRFADTGVTAAFKRIASAASSQQSEDQMSEGVSSKERLDALDRASRDYEIAPLFEVGAAHQRSDSPAIARGGIASSELPARVAGSREGTGSGGEGDSLRNGPRGGGSTDAVAPVEKTEEVEKVKEVEEEEQRVHVEEDKEWPCLHNDVPHSRPNVSTSGLWVPYVLTEQGTAPCFFECRVVTCRKSWVADAGGADEGRTLVCPGCGATVGACCKWRSNKILLDSTRRRRRKSVGSTSGGRRRSGTMSAGNSPMISLPESDVLTGDTSGSDLRPRGGMGRSSFCASMTDLQGADDESEPPSIMQLKASIRGGSVAVAQGR